MFSDRRKSHYDFCFSDFLAERTTPEVLSRRTHFFWILSFLAFFPVAFADHSDTLVVLDQKDSAVPDYRVKKLPEESKVNDSNEILISYTSAVSTIDGNIDDILSSISQPKKSSTSDDRETFSRKMNDFASCLSTDFYGSIISGALVVAVEEINNDTTLLPNHTLKYIFGNTCGNDTKSTKLFMNHWQAGARVFIGPEKNCKTEAAMASAQNLPIISYRCNDQEVSREDYHYKTFARTVPPSGEIFKAFLSLCYKYNWRKFSVVYEIKKGHNEMFETLKRVIERENLYLNDETKFEIMNASLVEFSEVKGAGSIQEAIRTTKETTRIYLAFDNVRLFRKILATMGDMGLTELDYLLIYLDTSYDWLDVYHAMNNHFLRNTMNNLQQSWDATNSSDRKMVDYARSALAIIPTPVKLTSQRFHNFWSKANEHLHYFGVQKSGVLNVSIKANRIACYLYDAVYLYARAVHELIEINSKDAINDGKLIIDRIVNRKYRSIQGFDMRIDERGNAKGNYTLLSWQVVEPRMNDSDLKYYPMSHALDITATFVEPEEGARLPLLEFKRKKIHWPLGPPPLDEPPCGFRGEKCIENSNHVTLIFALLFVFLGIGSAAAAGLSYSARSRKFEKELSMIWRIDSREVHRIVRGNGSATSLLAPGNEVRDESWFGSTKIRGSGLRGVAYYKGTLVALKEITYDKKPKELTRALKKELRIMRQLANPNLNNFMGIILCPISVCSVREFCTKGSLMDILRTEDLKLDHLYIASFIEDLVKGMIYLHDSELRVHGNLKSTNCLITSRWALQIADYGLYDIRDGMRFEDSDSMWENLLWTAPELLRVSGDTIQKNRPTQKADVYSFAIILQEILTREGPFRICGNVENHSEQVVRRIAIDPDFRPLLNGIIVQNYVLDTIRQCWATLPEHRPDFKHGVRTRLKPLFSQIYKRNIMDHMILMMERYQTHLEDLVTERTSELREEQERSQRLLQRMLPRSVANQLMCGGDVTPEAFPPVTIYFSDIVGFTRISGESTPMQVVAFLNQLYTLFDSVIRLYTVYKVETIGDAYMVVSGVPKYQTEEYHAEQIGTMALHLLKAVKTFEIPHRKEEQLMLRIGLHTGPCVAGVVGKTMPRYCLFGDTVNTASRMESNGEPLRIHCSQTTQEVLKTIPGFDLEERGSMVIKGKGHMKTYWLNNRIGYEFVDDGVGCFADIVEDPLGYDIFPRTRLKIERGSNWGVWPFRGVSFGCFKTTMSRIGGHLGLGAPESDGNSSKTSTTHTSFDSSWPNSNSHNYSEALRAHVATRLDSFANWQGDVLLQETSRSKPPHSNTASEGHIYVFPYVRWAFFFDQTPDFGSRLILNYGRNRSMTTRCTPSTSTKNCFAPVTTFHGSRLPSYFEYGEKAIRKRSTSLPDGEVLNVDYRTKSTADKSTAPDSSITSRREKPAGGRNCSCGSKSPTSSQYPSYQDLNKFSHRRKQGMATIWPPRKRSLSVGDALPQMSVAIQSAASQMPLTSRYPPTSSNSRPTENSLYAVPSENLQNSSNTSYASTAFFSTTFEDNSLGDDDAEALIGNPLRYFANDAASGNHATESGFAPTSRRTPKQRRSMLNLHNSLLRDPSPLTQRIRDASPFSGKRFWLNSNNSREPRSRGESLTRMWRRLRSGRSTCNNYEDLRDDNEEDVEMENFARSSEAKVDCGSRERGPPGRPNNKEVATCAEALLSPPQSPSQRTKTRAASSLVV
ncbi:unnamed protein product [Caenorhabditis auriculariae]|uniref:Guanylate cyclase n=1 Tax=Caenorhabditis auriculariae TaxID=2777116 RepID=A0A8S1HHW3_9PELO|nr:unnamed protein product [Caenorhabditis auriculariae]